MPEEQGRAGQGKGSRSISPQGEEMAALKHDDGVWKTARQALCSASIALAAVLVTLSIVSAPASAASLGLQWTGNYGPVAEEMSVVRKSGASLFRLPMEPSRTSYGTDWKYYDAVFSAAANNGITILPYVLGNMKGENHTLPGSGEQSAWNAWMKNVVKRYGYNGSFWSSHPSLPSKPVVAWELGNEPNNQPDFGTMTAAEYGAFLGSAGRVAQDASNEQAGRGTDVLFAGLLAWGGGVGYQTYLENAYKVSGVSSAVTGIAFHPYLLDTSKFAGESRIDAFKKAVNGARTFIDSLNGGEGSAEAL